MPRTVRAHVLVLGLAATATAHDIPDEQVDRSIQVTVSPGRLEIDYEVSLAELTLVRDLRRLVGVVPGADRPALFDRYGRETGPLNAKGLLVTVDGRPLALACERFDLAVEEHPRYTFHLAAPLADRGRLVVQDTNYIESQGTSRLAVQGAAGVAIRGDDLPTVVADIPIRPDWQLTDAEERRTRRAEFDFAVAAPTGVRATIPPASPPSTRPPAARGLGAILGRASWWAWLLALGLGVAHAVQPGHGKTLVAAATLGGRRWDGVVLAVVTTLTHFAVVVALALALWATRSQRYAAWDLALARVAGFAIAAVGFWRLGRHLGRHGEHDDGPLDPGRRGVIGLGLAGGLLPCWDAVLLVVLAESTGRLGWGLVLLSAFCLGMAGVLLALAWASAGLRRRLGRDGAWPRRLGLASGLALALLGLVLLGQDGDRLRGGDVAAGVGWGSQR